MQLCCIQLLYATKLHRLWWEVSCCMLHETCCLELDQWSNQATLLHDSVACNKVALCMAYFMHLDNTYARLFGSLYHSIWQVRADRIISLLTCSVIIRSP